MRMEAVNFLKSANNEQEIVKGHQCVFNMLHFLLVYLCYQCSSKIIYKYTSVKDFVTQVTCPFLRF